MKPQHFYEVSQEQENECKHVYLSNLSVVGSQSMHREKDGQAKDGRVDC